MVECGPGRIFPCPMPRVINAAKNAAYPAAVEELKADGSMPAAQQTRVVTPSLRCQRNHAAPKSLRDQTKTAAPALKLAARAPPPALLPGHHLFQSLLQNLDLRFQRLNLLILFLDFVQQHRRELLVLHRLDHAVVCTPAACDPRITIKYNATLLEEGFE
jgi:hypothetical protein